MPIKKSRRFTIRFTVVSIFVVATVTTAAIAVSLQYYFSREMATEAAIERFNNLADVTSEYLSAADTKAEETTRVLANFPGLIEGQWVTPNVRELFSALMHESSLLHAVYIGFDNGDFYEVVNLNSGPNVRSRLAANVSDRWAVISIREVAGQRQRQTDFYSSTFELTRSVTESTGFDARLRPWFLRAQHDVVTKSAPYLFQILQEPGQTYSAKIEGGVVAVDVALSSISEYLQSKRAEQYGSMFLYSQSGEIIATNNAEKKDLIIPPMERMQLSSEEQETIAKKGVLLVSNELDWAPIDFTVAGEPSGYSVDYLKTVAQLTGLQFEFVNGLRWQELVEFFELGKIDILQPIFNNDSDRYPGQFSQPFLDLPYSIITNTDQATITHFNQLNGSTIAVPEGWSIIPIIQQHFPDVNLKIVATSREMFEQVKNGQVDGGLDSGEILHYIGEIYFYTDLKYHDNIDFSPIDFPTALHFLFPEKHYDLVPIVNRAINQVGDVQKIALAQKWFYGDSQVQGLASVPYPALIELTTKPEQQRKLVAEDINGVKHNVFVAPFGRGADEFFAIVIPFEQIVAPALDKVKVAIAFTAAFLLLLFPAPILFASPIVHPIKKLADENEKIRLRQHADLKIPHSYIKEIDELGVSMKNMVDAILAHEAKQIALMDSFIQLIAQAIDDKSHYTAGHCARVPELALMLIEKVSSSIESPFDSFEFKSEEERREFKIAAWLHDCGKITTPDHVVDKGSKLETIYNRIHEIRTRFEVLWRDAEIKYWQGVAKNADEQAALHEELQRTHQQLFADFEFVASMNVGGEYLDADKKLRLQQIAQSTWIRHFSDQIGLSPLEESRLTEPETPLPCEEFLLADKPTHLIPREHTVQYDPKLGIKMEVPEYLYNQGELYNLSIERGTLTAEDRFKINEHIISTIKMLDALPFPDELQRVARYASTHHETMKGTGYPRKLTREDLSIPERVMVLADIFEALTAADRPYKKAKLVSVAIDIMAKMVADDHIDRDVFHLFLTSGVYLEYARRFLPEGQIDEVDVEKYLSK